MKITEMTKEQIAVAANEAYKKRYKNGCDYDVIRLHELNIFKPLSFSDFIKMINELGGHEEQK